jgi:RHS repeat-associated protein
LLPTLVLAQSQDQNYIKTTTYKVETTVVPTPSNVQKTENITYYDGLGRPIQKVAHQQSASGKDIVSPIEYDGFGRNAKEYLPYVNQNTPSLDFIPTAVSTDVGSYYLNTNPNVTGNPNFETTNNPYSQKEFEASPLDRLTKQAAPGDPWSMGSGHEIKYEYQTNIPREVRKFKVVFAPGTTETHRVEPSGFYTENSLYKTVTKTENWTPTPTPEFNNTTQEFKDNEGRVVLKRTFSHDVVPNSFPVAYADLVYNTYYVYDIYGNLSYVIPPLASDAIDAYYVTTTVTNRNYPWTKLAQVTGELAEEYNKLFSEYKNELIANADLYTKYGGQGGFTLSTNSNNEPVLSITMNTLEPMELRLGEITSLKELGDFKDSEIGRIQGEGYEYVFYIKGNVLMLEGKGKVSNINTTFNGNTKLVYSTNYPWSSIVDIDSKESEKYKEIYNQYDNATILTRNVENSYGAIGGLTISVDENDKVTANLAITSVAPLKLKNGIVITLKTERRIADTDLGVIEAEGLKYRLSIKENSLYIEGEGSFTSLSSAKASNPVGVIILPIPIDIIEGLCYQYHYDERNRLVEKKIPGKGWEYIVYDKVDRVALSQDANLRSQNKWLFTKYDVFNRVIYTGDFKFYSANTDSNLRVQLQGLISSNATSNEDKSSVFVNGGITINYSEGNFPNSTNNDFRVFTVNYYDDYSFQPYGVPISIPPSITFNGSTIVNMATNVKSLSTGSLVRILETNNWIVNLTAYDTRFRPFWSKSENSYLQTTDESTSLLDFTGKILQTVRNHSKTGVISNLGVIDRFTYDNADRLIKQTQTVGSNPEELIASNQYDELGNLIQKKVGGLANAPNGLQTVDYSYNIRGWLKTINDPNNSLTDDLFAFKINYNTPQLGATPMYNGNISETSWRTKNDNNQRNYKYSYDNLNRLTNADYVVASPIPLYNNGAAFENYSEGNIQYDKNGNITHLERSGLKDASPSIGVIDNLSYLYNPRSNQLKHVVDTSIEPAGFNDVSLSSQQPDGSRVDLNYAYDINGNMIKDNNKKIFSITYNHLNLPTRINFKTNIPTDTKYIEYVYDAVGTKLKKIIKNENSPNLTTTQYDNGYIYENSVLKFFSQPEGYVANDNGVFSYVYQYKDHLGNVRLSYTKNPNTQNLDIVEENNYYPFGLKHSGYNNTVLSTNPANKYKYNGKELQDELGLNMYDYGARNYDPALGRWMNIDPLAEQSRRFSPYVYAVDNPVFFVDLDGNSFGPGPAWLRTIQFALAHLAIATQIGEYQKGTNNITTNATRFATTGSVLNKTIDANGKKVDEASQIGAFRHTLWQATIASKFGSMIAKEAGDAHEENPKAETGGGIYNVRALASVDEKVDLSNNIIGRKIGEANPNLGMKDLAMKILETFKDEGLFTGTKTTLGTGQEVFIIARTKLSNEQYNQLKELLNNLNNNGRTEKQQKKIDEFWKKESERMDKQLLLIRG